MGENKSQCAQEIMYLEREGVKFVEMKMLYKDKLHY
jgi:hypothetical protein